MHVPPIELDLPLPLDRLRFDRVLFLDIDGVLHPLRCSVRDPCRA